MDNRAESLTGPQREEVLLLIENSLRGDVSDEDTRRLEEFLANPVWMKQYVEYVLQTVSLGVWASALNESGESGDVASALQPCQTEVAPADSTAGSQRVSFSKAVLTRQNSGRSLTPSFSGSARWPYFTGGAISAFLVSVAAFLLLTPVSEKPLAESRPLRESVAFLTVDNGCDWGVGSPLLRTVGGPVNPGESITLYEGLAEFSLGSDVRLSVEGPASLVIGSPSTFVLLHGKVTVNVPRHVDDFKCIAAGCQFTARDAEFGLWQEGSKMGVHVFAGEVRAAAPFVAANLEQSTESTSGEVIATGASVFSRALITAGHALSLTIDDDELKMANMGEKATPEIFATKLSMSDVLPISQAYVSAVQAARPIGYWRFNSITDGMVENEVKGGSKLKSVGTVGLSGHGLNRVAEFLPSTRCCLLSEGSLDELAGGDYSIEAWVKPSHTHRGRLLTLASGAGDQLCMASLELQPPLKPHYRRDASKLKPSSGMFAPGTIRFVHHNPKSGKPFYDTSCHSQDRYHVRRWQHLVAVKQGPEMRMYIDGHLVASALEHTTLSPGVQLRVGSDVVNQGRNFVGQLDDVAVYDRALTVDEIRGHYTLIDWSLNSRGLERRDDI